MSSTSIYTEMRRLEDRFKIILRSAGSQELAQPQQKLVKQLRQQLTDTRLDVRDTEYAETKQELDSHAQAARVGLKRINKAMLQLSEDGLFGVVDVAELGALIEHVSHNL